MWPNWSAAGYDSFDWDAAFGNPYSLPYNTLWSANTDLALHKTFDIDGLPATPITLNVASDNGFMVFINGTQVAKANGEGYTAYWEYTFPLSTSVALSPGINVIQVLAEGHGGATFFDLKLTVDVCSCSRTRHRASPRNRSCRAHRHAHGEEGARKTVIISFAVNLRKR